MTNITKVTHCHILQRSSNANANANAHAQETCKRDTKRRQQPKKQFTCGRIGEVYFSSLFLPSESSKTSTSARSSSPCFVLCSIFPIALSKRERQASRQAYCHFFSFFILYHLQ